MPAHTFLAGAHLTRFGVRPEGLLDLLVEAGRGALEKGTPGKPDLLVVGCMDPSSLAGLGNIAAALAGSLGLSGIPAYAVETASSTGAAALHLAAKSVAAGDAERALVVAGEKLSPLTVSRATSILARVLAPEEQALGATMPALAALLTRIYLERHGFRANELTCLAMKSHRNGARNPIAHFQTEITEEAYLAARMVADPLRRFDIAPISDGAAAVIVARTGHVRIAGLGGATDPLAIASRSSLPASPAMARAGKRAIETSKRSRGEIRVAEIHDAFTPFEVMAAEDLGFFPPGGGLKAALRGETDFGARLVLNPSGGLKSRGHPVGASGLAQVCELFGQLTGTAGPLQVDGAKVGLAASVGGMLANNFVTVLEAV